MIVRRILSRNLASTMYYYFKTLGARKICRKPYAFKRLCDRRFIIYRKRAPSFRFGLHEALKVIEQPYSVFTVIAAGSAEFVQYQRLFFAGRSFITQINRFKVFHFCSGTHNITPFRGLYYSVTSIMSQRSMLDLFR